MSSTAISYSAKAGFADQKRFEAALDFALATKKYWNTTGSQVSLINWWSLESLDTLRGVTGLCYDLGLRLESSQKAVHFQRPSLTWRKTAEGEVNNRKCIVGSPGCPRWTTRLFVCFLNPQGNIDGVNTGLGEHPDFGGQLVYVREVARALGHLGVDVDIITRRFSDHRWPNFDIAEEILHSSGSGGRVRILRVPAGPRHFLRKEELWPYLEEWIHNIASLYTCEGRYPHASTGHYADGGFAAVLLSELYRVPFATFTAHSLGAQKIDGLLIKGKNLSSYNFEQRISAERQCMATARHIVVSTNAERNVQYAHPLYLGAVDVNQSINRFVTIPPGVDIGVFGAHEQAPDEMVTISALKAAISRDIPPSRRHLPIVIAAGRLEVKKNHINIVRAFAQSAHLRNNANLLLLLKGGKNAFKDPESCFTGAELKLARVIQNLLVSAGMQNRCVVVPGLENRQAQLAAIYRYLGRSRQGIFCLAADFEPFGLMPLEAIVGGVPAVVTQNGGTTESLQRDGQAYALLVDPRHPIAIADALHRLAVDPDEWLRLRDAGQNWVLDQYTWSQTAVHYRTAIREALA